MNKSSAQAMPHLDTVECRSNRMTVIELTDTASANVVWTMSDNRERSGLLGNDGCDNEDIANVGLKGKTQLKP